MALSRRALVTSLSASVLGTGALSGCAEGGIRRGRRRTTGPPTASPRSEPETPLVIGSIGSAFGAPAHFEERIGVAIGEAIIDINHIGGGLFGRDVVLAERLLMAEPGHDLSESVATLGGAGVTVVVASLEDQALIGAMPHFVEAGMAVIAPWGSSSAVRAEEVASSGLLYRLAPNDRAIARMYMDLSLAADGDRGGAPGTIAYVASDTTQGRSLLEEIRWLTGPENGRVTMDHFYPEGDLGDVDGLVAQLVEDPPAVLVLNGGPECAALASTLHTASLDEGNRPRFEVAVRLAPHAAIDHSGSEFAPESLTRATGYEPGGELAGDHVNQMLNGRTDMHTSGYAYTQQAYDAVVLACLASREALSVDGTMIGPAISRVLSGSESCTSFQECDALLREAQAAESTASVGYQGRTGPLELGSDGDPRTGALRTYSYDAGGARHFENAATFELTEA